MTAYWVVAVLMILFQLVPAHTPKAYVFRLLASFAVLFVYGAFRLNYGLDYEVYEFSYNIINTYELYDGRLEWGYVWLNKIVPSFRWLLVITSAFTCIAYIFFFYRLIPREYAWLGMLLLILGGDKTIFFMLSGIRNSISISILFLCYPLLEKRKLVLFFGGMMLASLFHKTAFVYFPIAYFLSSTRDMGKKEYLIWCGMFVFFWIFSSTLLIDYVSTFIGQYLDRYDSYVEKAMELGDSRGFLIRIATLFMFFPLVHFIRHHNISDRYNVIFRLALIFVFSYTLGALNMRTSHHFYLFFVTALIYMFSCVRNNYLKYGYMAFVLAFLFYSFFIIYMQNPNFPYAIYQSILF